MAHYHIKSVFDVHDVTDDVTAWRQSVPSIFMFKWNCHIFPMNALTYSQNCINRCILAEYRALFIFKVKGLITRSPGHKTGFCVVADYICGPSLVMIGQKLRPVSQKMSQFHLNMNIEGTIWRHAVTSLVTSSLWKSFWWMIYILSFYTCCQIEAILKTAKFFKLTKIWGPGELFIISVTGSMLY